MNALLEYEAKFSVVSEIQDGVEHFCKVLGDKPAVLAVARLPELASNNPAH
jgi:hypothetical protein